MFAKTIIDSDAFLDMPLSAQALYFHLSMRADDDGFVNNPKKIQRMIGAAADDLNLLAIKRFVIPFESGVCVIKHWRIHNLIRADRYKETVYTEEKSRLHTKGNKAYTLTPIEEIPELPDAGMTNGTPSDNQVGDNREPQVRLGKDRVSIEEDKKEGAPDEPPLPPPPEPQPAKGIEFGSLSPRMITAVEKWLQYKKERRESYKPTGLNSLISQIENNVDRYGEDAVIELIASCMAANWRGIIFDKLKNQQQPGRGAQRGSDGNIFAEMLNEGGGAL